MTGRLTAVGLVVLTGACAPRGAGVPLAAPPASGYQEQISPFPVRDSAGGLLELAFLGGLNQPRPQLHDLDGDGDLDLILQEYTGRLFHFERDGTTGTGLPRWRFRSRQYAGLDVGEWARFADLDGDGDLDLLAELPFSYLRYFRNIGGPGQPVFAPPSDTLRDVAGAAIFSDRQNIPQVGDIDCDGVPDLLIGRINGIILHYEADRAGRDLPAFRLLSDRFQDLEIITGQGSLHGANTMALVDHDLDGDPDLFWGDFFEAGLLLFENVGSCQAAALRQDPVRFPLRNPVVTSGYNAPAFGDVDGDGRLDLVIGVLGGAYDPNRTTIANLLLMTRDEAGGWVARSDRLLPQLDVGSESIPALVDWDGDGDLDLLVASKIEPDDRQTARIWRYENTGSARAPALQARGPLPLRGTYHYAPAFGDLDGDGALDMLVGSWKPGLDWYRIPRGGGDPVLVAEAVVTITRGSNTTPALGDLDGDGDLDLLIGEASGTLNYYRNDGTARSPRFTLVSDQWEAVDIGRRSAPHLVDWDGDGDLDLLIGTDDRGVVLYRNDGDRHRARFVPDAGFRLELPPLVAPATGDLDGDGRLELIVGTIGGGVLFFTRP